MPFARGYYLQFVSYTSGNVWTKVYLAYNVSLIIPTWQCSDVKAGQLLHGSRLLSVCRVKEPGHHGYVCILERVLALRVPHDAKHSPVLVLKCLNRPICIETEIPFTVSVL
jgi:hypothetical protein